MNPESVLLHLAPPDPALFFTKDDSSDPRMGDLTARDLTGFPDGTRAVLLGVPQDIGVERNGGRTGAALAPDVIRAMLYRLTPYDPAKNVSIPPDFLFDAGNIRCDGSLEDIHDRLRQVVTLVSLAGLVPITLGGGHDISYATISGTAQALGRLGCINLDAHLDVRQPNPLRNSGTPFRMLLEEDRLLASAFVEFGIQGHVNAAAHTEWLKGKGGRIITLDEIRTRGFSKSLATAYLMASTGTAGVHGSLDIDGVRAANAPGVSAPSPSGLSAGELLNTARTLGRRAQTVALDVVEVNPQYDNDNITSKLAAHAVMQFLTGLVERG